MAYLSRNDIEGLADHIIKEYKAACVPEKHMCYSVDPVQLAHLYGYNIEYAHITRDGSILGQTSSGGVWTTILDDDMNETYFYLDGKTILIDTRLLTDIRCTGRRHFTIAHELAHQFINRAYPELYGPQCRTFCDYRRSVKPHKKISDWHEWQADTLAAAILLPRDAIEDSMFMFGLGKKLKVLSRKYSQENYECFCNMASYLQVSRTALAFRMEQLGLLGRNRLIEEAQKRKGVA